MSLEEECVAGPALRTVNTARSVDTAASDSPLNFPHCVRGRLRPKEKRQGAPTKKAEKRKNAEETFDTLGLVPEALRQYMIVPPKKTRGRPAGSKNKEKPSKSQTMKSSIRELADPQYESEYFDSGDTCNVCGFQLNHPTKVDKPVISCNICSRLVHKPCIEKYGELCVCQK